MKKGMVCRMSALGMLVVFFIISIASFAGFSHASEITVEKKTYPYVKAFDPDSEESSIDLYFIDGGDIPYVAVSEYMSFYSDIMNFEELGEISFETSLLNDHFYSVKRTDNEAIMMLDTEDDTIFFTDFNQFIQGEDVDALIPIMNIPDPEIPDTSDLTEKLMDASTEEEQNEILEEIEKRAAGEPDQLFHSESSSINRAGSSLMLRLCDYLIDLVESDGECYVPLQTFNDMFMGPFYLQFVFNGKKLYGFEYGSDPISEIYDAGPEEMSHEFAQFNFNELCFFLDCFYGLKEEHNIDSFASLILANPEIYEGLTSTDPKTFDTALGIFLSRYLDDGHTAFTDLSWRCGALALDPLEAFEALSYSGISLASNNRVSARFSSARSAAYPDGVPMYEEIGDTAFITFDSFLCRADEDFSQYYNPENAPDPAGFVIREEENPFILEDFSEAVSDSDSEAASDSDSEAASDSETEAAGDSQTDPNEDTIWLLIYANQMIRRENSPIKNVVVDLSQNGGGQSDAALFVISWLTGRAQIALKDTFTSAESITSIAADVNLDNRYSSLTDSIVSDMNVYVLMSPLSFSCGNLVPAACKMAKTVTLVGQQSGGGSCSVLACTTASGSAFQMSSSMQLSIVKNGSFYNIDQGVEPDLILTKPESFYDREALAEYLKECK